MTARGYVPHIRPRNKEADDQAQPRLQGDGSEASHSWLNRYRKLVPRYEKTDLSYLALLELASGMIALNKVMVIYG